MSEPVTERRCPECDGPLILDKGSRETRDEPGTPPAAYCPDCGTDYPVTDEEHRALFGP